MSWQSASGRKIPELIPQVEKACPADEICASFADYKSKAEPVYNFIARRQEYARYLGRVIAAAFVAALLTAIALFALSFVVTLEISSMVI